jgi:hypothetical protein
MVAVGHSTDGSNEQRDLKGKPMKAPVKKRFDQLLQAMVTQPASVH